MPTTTILITGGWVLFWIYWLVSAFGAKKNARSGPSGFAGVRIGIFVLAIVLLRTSWIKLDIAGRPSLLPGSHLAAGIGLVVFALGLVVAVWARVYLGKNWGMPMSLKQDPELVTNGPYRLIRHPIYTGILVAMLGSALANSIYWLIALPVLGAYFVYSAITEERLMVRQFPKTYPNYKKRTKMLLPFVL